MPVWLQVVLGLAAPVSALLGVLVGSRQAAGTATAQWRRDRLLQFCADLLAAGDEVVTEAREMEEERETKIPRRAYPAAAIHRLQHSLGCVRLLSAELSPVATYYVTSAIDVLTVAEGSGAEFNAGIGRYGNASGKFQRAAYEHLRDFPSTHLLSELLSTVRRSR
jgi:hypothetical protein